jgi:clan AA aspartic protease (TIGR02281 family)
MVDLPRAGSALAADTAAAPAAAGASEDVLKEKGLVKVNNLYLVDADSKLPEDLKNFRAIKKKSDDDNKKRTEIEANIRTAKGAMGNWELEYRQLNEKLGTTTDAFQHNQMVGKINALVSKLNEGRTYLTAREGELAQLGNSRDEYVGAIIALGDKFDAIGKQYDALKADDAVKGALAKINEKARPKVALGPSVDYTQNAFQIHKQRETIKSDIVHVSIQGHVPHVDVNLNGKVTRSLVLDSGASLIALTSDLAKALDMTPGPQDPVIHMQLADGKVVEARQMVLKSVRVGQFTVENVECAVLPDTLVAADNLLGGSFLRNFVYKLDPEAGELHLNQVGGKPAAGAAPGAAATPGKPASGERKPDTTGGNPFDKPGGGGGAGGGAGGNPLDKGKN